MLIVKIQRTHSIKHCEDGDAHVGKNGKPHIRKSDSTQYKYETFNAEGKNNVLL